LANRAKWVALKSNGQSGRQAIAQCLAGGSRRNPEFAGRGDFAGAVACGGAFIRAKAVSPALDKALYQSATTRLRLPQSAWKRWRPRVPLESLSTNLVRFLLDHLDLANPWPIRNEAASVLGKAALDRDQLLVLAQALRAAGPSELPKLVSSFLPPPPMSGGVEPHRKPEDGQIRLVTETGDPPARD